MHAPKSAVNGGGHYQDDPNFIGPRLPHDHPAYRRYLDGQRAEPVCPCAGSTIGRSVNSKLLVDLLDGLATKPHAPVPEDEPTAR